MLHSLLLLLFMLVAAPLAGYIPLAALAGVLIAVCWSMAEKAEFIQLLRAWPTALVLLTTFCATLARDLTTGIILGCVMAAILWLVRKRIPEEGV
jgi:SulP family sulfate permease